MTGEAKWIPWVLTLGWVLGIGACAPEAARVRVSLILEDPPLLGPEATLSIRVEAEGKVQASLPPVPLGRGPVMSRTIPELLVPHGEGRELYAELREGEVLWRFGVSSPFALATGDPPRTIEVALVPPPVVALELESNGPGWVRTPTVTLQIVSQGATDLELSNEPNFGSLESIPVAASGVTRVEEWDLDRGRTIPCSFGSPSCPRQVYVRGREPHGYLSVVHTATVIVDRLPPQLLDPQASLTILGPSGNGALAPTAARPGARVSALLTPAEVLQAPPRLEARGSAGTLAFADCEAVPPNFRCALTVPELGAVEEPYSLIATLVDRAGHEARVLAGVLRYDAQPSPPPELSRLISRQAPFGSVSDPQPRAEIVLEPGALIPGAILVALDRAEAETAQTLGRSEPADVRGAAPPFLVPVRSRDELFVVAVDEAGWPSDADPSRPGVQGSRLLRSVTTAAFGAGHGHQAFWIADAGPGRDPAPDRARDPDRTSGALAMIDGNFARAEPSPLWTRRWPVSAGPEPRSHAGISFDPARQRVVLFGGRAGGNRLLDDTWIWDGRSWQSHDGPRHPGALRRPMMAYDGPGQRVLLFGGRGPGGVSGETWAFDDSGWSQLSPSVSPAARELGSMAYDPGRGAIVLYGGLGAGAANGFDDTWIWRSREETWELLPTVGSPGPRFNAAMAYDPVSQQVRIYGGSPDFISMLAEPYSLIGDEWRPWTSTGTVAPPPRAQAELVYDAQGTELLLLGGYDPPSDALQPAQDAYAYDLRAGRWRTITKPNDVVVPVATAASADPTGAVLLFGGGAGAEPAADTWIWRGTWQAATPIGGPTGRRGGALVGQPDGQTLELSGGLGGSPLLDTWRWTGLRFEPLADLPVELLSPVAARDPGTGQVVLCGDQAGAERCFVRIDAGWSEVPALGPTGRVQAGLTADPAGGVWLLGGVNPGGVLDECWRLHQGAWSTCPNLPGPRQGLAVTTDLDVGEVLAFGGEAPSAVATSSVWRFDGVAWQASSPAAPPPARTGAAFGQVNAFDGAVLFGGRNSAQMIDDLWLLRRGGLSERLRPASEVPPARFDAARAATVEALWIFGGCSDVECARLDDLWELRPGRSPALQANLRFGPIHQTPVAVSLELEHHPNVGTAQLELWNVERAAWEPVMTQGHRTTVNDGRRFLDGKGEVAVRIVDRDLVVNLDALGATLTLEERP
ncbi:MAG: hypothetical protein IPG45_25165 [Deltaproteobacteria bacterium]|nr:hypothetical protein [Deltaproteobacteria bacterium]